MVVLFILLFAGLTVILWSSTEILSQTSPVGEQRLIVIPVYFSNVYPSMTVEQIRVLVFQDADHYIRETSYGQAWLAGDVFNWTLVSHPMEWYGGEDGAGAPRLVTEAIGLTDSYIDFSGYDRLLVIHSGWSSQYSLNKSLIWTCNVPSSLSTADFRRFNSACLVAEYDHKSPAIGSIVHELMHDFGALDLYNGTSEQPSLSEWELMASGNNNDQGNTPAGLSAYSKYVIGWITGNEIYSVRPGTHEIALLDMAGQESGLRAAKYDLGWGRSFLVEARGSIGYDTSLPGPGVLVTLIDEGKEPKYGRAELMVPPGCNIEGAAWKVGQVFYDKNSGFGMKVLNDTGKGYTIELSTLGRVSWRGHTAVTLKPGLEIVPNNRTIAVTNSAGGRVYAAFEMLNTSSSSRYIQVCVSFNEGQNWEPYFRTEESCFNRRCPSLAVITDSLFLMCECERIDNHTIEAWNCTANTYVNVTNPSLDDARQPVASPGEWGLYVAYQLLKSNLSWSVEYPIIAYRFMNETGHWFGPSFYSDPARAYMLSEQIRAQVGYSYSTYGPYFVFITDSEDQTSSIGVVEHGLMGPVTRINQNVSIVEMCASVGPQGLITVVFSYIESEDNNQTGIRCIQGEYRSDDWIEIPLPTIDESQSLPRLLSLENGSVLLFYKAGSYLYELSITENKSAYQPSSVQCCSANDYTITRLILSSLWSEPLVITSGAEALSYYYSTPPSPRDHHIYVPSLSPIGVPPLSWAVPAVFVSLSGLAYMYAGRLGGVRPLLEKIRTRKTMLVLLSYGAALVLTYSLSWLVTGAFLFIVWVPSIFWIGLAAVSVYFLLGPLWDDMKPRQCPFCDEMFDSSNRLANHINDEHTPAVKRFRDAQELEASPKWIRLQCPHCSAIYHYRVLSDSQRDFVCQNCARSFLHPSDLGTG